MARRTLADATNVLKGLLPSLPPRIAEPYQELLRESKAMARRLAFERLSAEETDALSQIGSARDELTTIRQEYEALIAGGNLGRVSVLEYRQRLKDFAHRQARAEALLGSAAAAVESVARLESNPLGWYDETARRFPSMLPDFPW